MIPLQSLSDFHNRRKPVDGAFFSGANDGYDGIDGDFVPGTFLQLLLKLLKVNVGVIVDFNFSNIS